MAGKSPLRAENAARAGRAPRGPGGRRAEAGGRGPGHSCKTTPKGACLLPSFALGALPGRGGPRCARPPFPPRLAAPRDATALRAAGGRRTVRLPNPPPSGRRARDGACSGTAPGRGLRGMHGSCAEHAEATETHEGSHMHGDSRTHGGNRHARRQKESAERAPPGAERPAGCGSRSGRLPPAGPCARWRRGAASGGCRRPFHKAPRSKGSCNHNQGGMLAGMRSETGERAGDARLQTSGRHTGGDFPASRPVVLRLAPRAWPAANRQTPDKNGAARERKSARGSPAGKRPEVYCMKRNTGLAPLSTLPAPGMVPQGWTSHTMVWRSCAP